MADSPLGLAQAPLGSAEALLGHPRAHAPCVAEGDV